MSDFEEYMIQGEPSQKEKAQIWQTAIGLQDVDGLNPSAKTKKMKFLKTNPRLINIKKLNQ